VRAQHTLFGESIRLRPKRNDDRCLRLAAEMTLADLLKWNPDLVTTDDDRKETIAQLISAGAGFRDGYEVAERLQRRYYWEPDTDMVETLNAQRGYDAHRQMVVDWVKAEGIIPAFKVGDRVKVHAWSKDLSSRDWHEGEVLSIYAETAEYSVHIESLGHVKRGSGTHGQLFPFEDVEEWNADKTAAT
jgi:hypothetical protein